MMFVENVSIISLSLSIISIFKPFKYFFDCDQKFNFYIMTLVKYVDSF